MNGDKKKRKCAYTLKESVKFICLFKALFPIEVEYFGKALEVRSYCQLVIIFIVAKKNIKKGYFEGAMLAASV